MDSEQGRGGRRKWQGGKDPASEEVLTYPRFSRLCFLFSGHETRAAKCRFGLQAGAGGRDEGEEDGMSLGGGGGGGGKAVRQWHRCRPAMGGRMY